MLQDELRMFAGIGRTQTAGLGDGVDAPYGIAMCQDGGVETTI
jgi:hypothetical protein